MAVGSYERAAEVLRAVAHPVRLRILDELLREERCVSAIQERIPVTQPNLSQHLAALRSVGLIDFLQDGQRRCYYLVDRVLVEGVVRCLQENGALQKETRGRSSS